MLSIPVRTVFLNHAFFHFDFLTPNIWQSDDVVRFRKRREVWLRASPKHTLTKDKDSPRCVQCNLRAVGQPMLLDNGWLSNTATVRGQTRGPIRIYPTSTPSLLSKWYGLPCERSFDTHTQYIHSIYTHLGPLSSPFLTGNYAYSSQPIFHSPVWGVVVM